MRLTAVLISGGLLALLSSPLVQAQSVIVPAPGPSCLPGTPSGTYISPVPSIPSTSPSVPGTTPSTQPGQQPQVPMPQGADAAAAGLGAQAAAGASGTSGREGQAQMIGDLGIGGFTTVVTGRLTSFSIPGSSNGFNFNSSSGAFGYALSGVQQQPINALGGSAIKISDNESPAPVDRVFATYNYFGLHSPDGTNGDLHRELVGFEKTFLDGNASIGMRVPYFQTTGFNGVDQSDLGDLSIIGKFALLNDKESGSLLSLGAMVTVPTGPNTAVNQFTAARDVTGATFLIPVSTSNLNSTFITPYAGWVLNLEGFYLQGFSSAILPTDSTNVRLLTNSVGLNYRAYKSSDESSMISSLIPAIEAHVTTPLNHRGSNSFDGIGFPDICVLTAGVHVGLCNHAWMTFGAATSVTGPRAYDVEGVCQLNFMW